MKLGEVYTKNQIDKLGNAMVYLCQQIKPISKTHLLKLVFIIEEIAIKKYGIPFFNLRFDLWKLGPVSKDLFVELSGEPDLLSDYIARESGDSTNIVPQKSFNDDEFSDNELELLNEVVTRFKYCTSTELVNYTHRKGTPWYETAVQNGVLELLESGKMTTTDIEINLSELIKDDDRKLNAYNSYKEFVSLSKTLKR